MEETLVVLMTVTATPKL